MYKQSGKFFSKLPSKTWKGRWGPSLMTSDRLGRQDRHGKPPARQTQSPKPRRARKIAGYRLYLAKFTSLKPSHESFVKIGLSSQDLKARFQLDIRNYGLEILAESARFSSQDANVLEKAIHHAFRKRRMYPKIPLMSGNTECYLNSEDNITLFKKIIETI